MSDVAVSTEIAALEDDAATAALWFDESLSTGLRFLPLAANLGEVFPDGAAVLYGEGYGAKIQKGGGNYRADQDFVLFDVRVGSGGCNAPTCTTWRRSWG